MADGPAVRASDDFLIRRLEAMARHADDPRDASNVRSAITALRAEREARERAEEQLAATQRVVDWAIAYVKAQTEGASFSTPKAELFAAVRALLDASTTEPGGPLLHDACGTRHYWATTPCPASDTPCPICDGTGIVAECWDDPCPNGCPVPDA